MSPLLVNDEGSPDLNLRMNSVEDSVDDTDDVSFVTTFNVDYLAAKYQSKMIQISYFLG